MLEITINKNDAGQRVDKFLQKTMQNATNSMIYKWIRLKKIKVNRSRCENNQKLNEGDIVQFFIPHDFIKQSKPDFFDAKEELEIEFENNDFIVVWKPKGLLIHSDKNEQNDTLIQRVLLYLYNTKQYNPELENSFTPATVHRLDRNTEGFVLIAKNAETLRNLNQLMQEHLIQKKYVCVITKALKNPGILTHYHYKDQNGKVYISDKPKANYKKIVTHYKPLIVQNGYTLVEIELITGKSHQIRAQFSHIGAPLYGDLRYGSKFKSNYQTLSAYFLKFTYDQEYLFIKKQTTTHQIFIDITKNK